MPQNQGQFGHLLALLAQLQQGTLAGVRIHHLGNPLQHPSVLVTDTTGSCAFADSIPLSLSLSLTLYLSLALALST